MTDETAPAPQAVALPPKPQARRGKVSLLEYLRLFQRDILSAQPAHLYRAWMAEMKTPFFRSFLCNEPDLVHRVLRGSPHDFPKSERIRFGLKPLLRDSVVGHCAGSRAPGVAPSAW